MPESKQQHFTKTNPVRVLVSGWPFFGHTEPLFEIGELLARDCDVRVYPYTLEVKAWAKGHGLSCIDAESPALLESFNRVAVGELGQAPCDAEKAIQDWVASVYEVHFQRWLDVLEEDKPTLALLDYSLCPAIDACHKVGVPFVTVGQQAGYLRPVDPAKPAWCSAAAAGELSDEQNRAEHLASEQATAELEATRKRVLGTDYVPLRTRVAEGPFIIGADEISEPSPPENSHLVGFFHSDVLSTSPTRADEELLSRFGKEDVILCSFGSMTAPGLATLTSVIEGIGKSGYRGIMRVARRDLLPDYFATRAREAGVEIATDWIAQNWWLQQDNVVAFITHGGHAAVREAVQAGKPILAIPQLRDQFYNSARLAEAGIALRILGEPDSGTVANALERLTSDSEGFKNRIQEAQQAMNSLGGLERAREIVLRELDALAAT